MKDNAVKCLDIFPEEYFHKINPSPSFMMSVYKFPSLSVVNSKIPLLDGNSWKYWKTGLHVHVRMITMTTDLICDK